MLVSLDCTSSMSGVIKDLKRVKSSARAAGSESGSVTHRQGLVLGALGLVIDRASKRVCQELSRLVAAWPTGMAMSSTSPQYFLRVATRGAAYFCDLSGSFSLQLGPGRNRPP